MSEQSSNQKPNDDEIDLGVVFGEIKRLFISFLKAFFSIFIFIYKHKFVLIVLLVSGIIAGYFWDKVSKPDYKSNLTLVTNYSSTDYLYSKIEALESKIKQEDSIYLQQVFGQHYDLVKNVKVEPILDIYKFIAQSEINKEIFELLLDEQDNVDEFLESPINSYNYPYHKVNFIIKGQNHHELISNQFISYINDNKYFNDIKEILVENYEQQLIQNKEVIKQIDNIIESVNQDQNTLIENLKVSVGEDEMINDLLQKKKDLLINNGQLKTQIQNQQNIIKTVDSNYALEDKEKITKKDKKYLLPLLLVGLYMLIYLTKYLLSKAKRFYAS